MAEDLRDAVDDLEDRGMERLVLDIRGNGGGRIDAAASVAGEFLTVQRDFRGFSTREYYRATRDERERMGRPSCVTAAVRTVYGGAGIHPDVFVPIAPRPVWMDAVAEENLLLRWIPGLVEERVDLFADRSSVRLDEAAELIGRR